MAAGRPAPTRYVAESAQLTDMKQFRKKAKEAWFDPVWSKVIAAVIIAAGSSLFVWLRSYFTQTASTTVLTQAVQVLSFPVPLWAVLVSLPLLPLLLLLVTQLRRLRYILIRADAITGNSVNRIHYPRDSFNTVNQLIDRLIRDFEEEGLGDHKFGVEWVIVDPANNTWIEKRSDMPLRRLGIGPGSELEIIKRFWKDR